MTSVTNPAHALMRLVRAGRERRIVAGVAPLAAAVLLTAVVTACGGTSEPDALAESSTKATTPADAGQSLDSATIGDIRGLAVDPAGGNAIAVTSTGLFRQTGADQGWEPVSTSNELDWENVTGVVFNPDNPAHLYLYGADLGVLRSDNSGQDWQAVADGLPSDDIGALAIHSNRRETLYAWIEGQGVFRTEDGGQQWEMMDEGPGSAVVRALTHSPLEGSMNTGWLYAATPEGVYLSMDCF